MFGASSNSKTIEDEIHRLERRQAEIEVQLKKHNSSIRHGALQQHLSNLDRTLIALRQQQNRMTK